MTTECLMRTGCVRVRALLLTLWISAAQSNEVAIPAPALREYSARVINPKLTGGLYESASKTLLIWGTDGTILRSTDALTWTYASTPTAFDLTRLAVDSEGQVLIAVGAGGTILRSQDSGRRWIAATVDRADTDLRAVVHHASSGTWIAAGTNGAILRSTDSGRTWRALDSDLDLSFEALFVEPTSGDVLIGAEHGVVGRSTDAGISWNLTRIRMPQPVTPITGFHAFAGQLLATSALGRFLVSQDHGRSWQLVSVGTPAYFTDAAFDPEHEVMLLASHTGDVFRRAASDEAWEHVPVAADEAKKYLSSVRYDAATRSLLAVGHHGTALRSVDGGRQWQQVSVGFPTSLESLLHADGGRYVAFGDGGFVLVSTDSGRSWQRVAPDLSGNLRELVMLPGGGAVLASGELGTVLRSPDGGASWTSVEVAYPNLNTPPNLRSLLVVPTPRTADVVLVAAGAPGTIIRSGDGGVRWEIAHWTPLEKEEAFSWLLSDPERRVLLAIEARGSMYMAKDGARTWQRSKIETDRELWHGTASPRTGTLLIAGQRGVAARSEDGGRSWRAVDTGIAQDLFGSYAVERSGHLFLLGGQGLILHSTDDGRSWQRRAAGTTQALRRMLADPGNEALVAFGEHGSIVRSEDGGETWRVVASGTDAELRKGLVEPGSNHLLIVGQQGMILRSADAGRSWQPLFSHTLRHFRSAAFTPGGDLVAVGERIVRLTRLPAPTSR
jgi:photosystem II stability/assembly factor-like uncharacterized protein